MLRSCPDESQSTLVVIHDEPGLISRTGSCTIDYPALCRAAFRFSACHDLTELTRCESNLQPLLWTFAGFACDLP
jgi:hypothetical protein